MEALKNITALQWIGIVLIVNGVLTGSVNEMTDLLGAVWAKHIVSLCVMGSGICGGLITMFGGQGAMIKNVAAMPGVERITVNGNANQTLAQAASIDGVSKVYPVPQATDTVSRIAKGAAVLLAIAFTLALAASPAMAQVKLVKPTGDLAKDIAAATGKPSSSSSVSLTGDPAFDLVKMLDSKLLPDLQYAKQLADANHNTLTSGCWGAWIDLINTNENAVKNPDGSPQDPPDPHLVTTLERAIDIRNALQPSAPFMVACSPVANLIKVDVLNFIGQVVGGGLSLTKLVPLL